MSYLAWSVPLRYLHPRGSSCFSLCRNELESRDVPVQNKTWNKMLAYVCFRGVQCMCVFMCSVGLCAGILSTWKHIPKCLIFPQSCQYRNALQTVHAQCSHTRKLSQKMTEDQIWSDMLRKHLYCSEMNRKRKKERKVANGKSCINVDVFTVAVICF